MTNLRCTKKLLDRLKLPAKQSKPGTPTASTAKLGDWYATYLPLRPKHLVLAISQRARLAVLFPAAPLQTLPARFLEAVRHRLEALCISSEAIEQELAAMGEVQILPTGADRCRATMGTMTQFLQVIDYSQERQEHPEEIALYLGRYLVGITGQRDYFRPNNVARELLDPATVLEESRYALQLCVTIQESDPPIWRRLLVPASLSLHQLHHVIQSAFSWKGCHLHEFTIGEDDAALTYGIRYQFALDLDGGPDRSDQTLSLFRALPEVGSQLRYVYDLGDYWCHEVVLEECVESEVKWPRCLAGERCGPPEDCGGIGSYQEILAALAGGSSPVSQRELFEWLEWAGPSFDPTAFDLAVTNRGLSYD
ncbi:IS1096 element passenger TnpR family protein [Armatimonas rosea]|uniref:IS1096 element passenger TnpR family protein n=1 Tax=Armatimonas rosea TaxID=685828 RepID=UPI0016116163